MMKKHISILAFLLIFVWLNAQEEVSHESPAKAKHSHQLKIGASLQYEFNGGYYSNYDYYYYDYYYHYSSRSRALENYDGPNTQLFIAYEHRWSFATSMALAIEPKLGLSFREYQTCGFLGANWKFYWVDKENWRMGIYLYTGYEYDQRTKTVYVPMDEGMYSQRMDINLNQHVFSTELGFIPFQFNLRSAPLVIEMNLNIIGLHVFRTKSSKYETGNGQTERLKYSEVGGYGPKIELKFGWQIK
ncbi:MAG: hypothetical protein DRJ15_06005 [Bacteroidetes bacterium]|nr:MAG: hypothetical protein DRJ15_06005 [Bacteroidota bacterium]